jgi:hypothetical protein
MTRASAPGHGAALPFASVLLLATATVGCPASGPPPRTPTYLGPVRAELVFENRLSGNFVLTEATWRWEEADLPVAPPAVGQRAHVGDVTAQSGEHTLHLTAKMRGEGSGVFSYLKGYKFEVRGTPKVFLDGPAVRIQCAALTREEPTLPLEQRPYIACVVEPL